MFILRTIFNHCTYRLNLPMAVAFLTIGVVYSFSFGYDLAHLGYELLTMVPFVAAVICSIKKQALFYFIFFISGFAWLIAKPSVSVLPEIRWGSTCLELGIFLLCVYCARRFFIYAKYSNATSDSMLVGRLRSPLNEVETSYINSLSEEKKCALDQIVMKNLPDRWVNVLEILGNIMAQVDERYPNLSEKYFVEKLKALCEQGVLQIKGQEQGFLMGQLCKTN